MAFPSPEARRAWYEANRDKEISRAKASKARYVERNQRIINDLRDGTPCADCGNYYPYYVMDFDHVTGDKVGNVTHLALRPVSEEKLMAEIAKCEIVCANCHRARTFTRRS